ncbi:MAG TPA: type II toxin-antitoxin system prevent-host-death family antitoxin [Acidimicrobiales bacterium]|nr:type II toxin-antitoxin system prevent-host-death family antitoxin [Acidimicrobiales bacterium]
MPRTMTVSEARAGLPEVIELVLSGEEVTLTRHGQAVAVVVRPDALRARRAGAVLTAAEDIHDLLEAARAGRVRPAAGISPERAEELVADVRAARAARQ